MNAQIEKAKQKLHLKSEGGSLGIDQTVWQAALDKAVPDPVVHIRHAPVGGTSEYRIHVAAIPLQVGCHFHARGNEDYAVVSGEGTLYWGKAVQDSKVYRVDWETPVDVGKDDSFVIPEGYAHQLRKRGVGDLVILFGCPDSHLNDDEDRTLLADAPL
jgi:mannose-6-phosphate isomerase-like protein (cupin superfamily)